MGKNLRGKELGKGIVQLKDKRYRASFVDKAKKKRVLYSFDLEEIKEALVASRAYYANPEKIDSTEVTLNSFFEIWLAEKAKKIVPSTVNHYRYAYNHVGAAFGEKRLRDVTGADFADLFEDMLDIGYAIAEIQCVKMVAGQVLTEAVRRGIMTTNPLPKRMRDIVSFVSEKKAVCAMSQEEQSRFLKYVFDMQFPEKESIAFVLLTGLRFGELAALRWEDIDWNDRWVCVERGMREYRVEGQNRIEIGNPKTKSARRLIPLLDEAVAILEMQKKNHLPASRETKNKYGNLVFTREGEIMTHTYYGYAIKRIEKELKAQEIPMCHVTPHVLRHTFITRCIESGMNPKAVAMIAGHKNIGITLDRYTTVDPTFLRESVERLNKKTEN